MLGASDAGVIVGIEAQQAATRTGLAALLVGGQPKAVAALCTDLLGPECECGRIGDVVAEGEVPPGEQLIAVGLGKERAVVIGLVNGILSHSVDAESTPYVALSETVAPAVSDPLEAGLVGLIVALSTHRNTSVLLEEITLLTEQAGAGALIRTHQTVGNAPQTLVGGADGRSLSAVADAVEEGIGRGRAAEEKGLPDA